MKHNLPTIEINGKTMYLYWCFGSNLNQSQMSLRCPDALPLDPAELPTHSLLFRGNRRSIGVATVERSIGSSVPGALWAISESDLQTLDRYEGFPTLYYRKNVDVFTDQGKLFTAMTYVMHQHYSKAVPSKEYLTTIYNGYLDFGLNTKRLRLFYDRHINDLTEMQDLAIN